MKNIQLKNVTWTKYKCANRQEWQHTKPCNTKYNKKNWQERWIFLEINWKMIIQKWSKCCMHFRISQWDNVLPDNCSKYQLKHRKIEEKSGRRRSITHKRALMLCVSLCTQPLFVREAREARGEKTFGRNDVPFIARWERKKDRMKEKNNPLFLSYSSIRHGKSSDL